MLTTLSGPSASQPAPMTPKEIRSGDRKHTANNEKELSYGHLILL